MTADFASFAGSRATSGALTIPLYGMWSADVAIASDGALADEGELKIGDLSLVGHVFRGAAYAGSRAARLAAGHGGWRKSVTAKPYRLPNGVPKSMVLRDAAREVRETVNVPNDGPVGTFFLRNAGPASDVLRALAGANWYVDAKGVTQIAAWPTKTIGSAFDVIDHKPDAGIVVIATETYAPWLPGASFSSPFLGDATYTIGGVRVFFTSEGVTRLEVLTQ